MFLNSLAIGILASVGPCLNNKRGGKVERASEIERGKECKVMRWEDRVRGQRVKEKIYRESVKVTETVKGDSP